MRRERVKLRAGDILVLVLALLGWIVSWRALGAGERAALIQVRSPQGERTYPFVASDLDAEGPLGRTRILCRDGRVRILSSPCPDGLCVKMGWIAHEGEALICLPNQVFVTLAPKGRGAAVDAISR